MAISNRFEVGINGPYFTAELAEGKAMNGADKITLSGLDRLEILMAQFEKALDYGGVIPGVNLISSPLRFLFGTVQLITALATKIIAAFGTTFADVKDMGYWEKFHNRASHHISQGVLNQGRALGEFIPLMNLFWLPLVLNKNPIWIEKHPRKVNIENKKVELRQNRYFYEGELKLLHITNHFKQATAA